jgi:hypothetical protein
MDPINKWLTVIIGFMVTLLIVISWKAGSGRYQMTVTVTNEIIETIYVLDTKNGDVQAKIVAASDLYGVDQKPRARTVKVFELRKPDKYGRRY